MTVDIRDLDRDIRDLFDADDVVELAFQLQHTRNDRDRWKRACEQNQRIIEAKRTVRKKVAK